ncbi:MAG TPA: hypothetical protein VGH13_00230, partial [Xanthobacteraceae bacterium]
VTFTKGALARLAGTGLDVFKCCFKWLTPRHSRVRGILHDRYIGPLVLESKGKVAAFHPGWRTPNLLAHDLFGKPVPSFPDHALASPG